MKSHSTFRKISFLCILLIAITVNVKSQNIIKGEAKDNFHHALTGVNVYLKGTYEGTSTDADGKFIINTSLTGKQTIVLQFMGFKKIEQDIILPQPDEKMLSFTLVEDQIALKEVNIVAGSFEASDKIKSVALQPMDIALTASSSADIYGALSTLPGTQLVGEEGKLFVRGGEAYEAKTFIDGLLVESPYKNTMPDMPSKSRFSPLLFSGTMFNTGGYSAEYGQALSSALILSTKGLPSDNLTNINLYSVGFGVSHTHKFSTSAIILSYDYGNLSPYYKTVKQNTDWIKAPESHFGTFNYLKKTKNSGLFKMLFSYTGDKSKLYYPYYGENNPYVPLGLQNTSYLLNNSYKGSIGEKSFIKAGMGFSYDLNRITLDGINLKDRNIVGQFKVTINHELSDRLKILYGTELIYKIFSELIKADNSNVNLKYTNKQPAFYSEAEIYLTNHLALRIGGRVEYSSVINKGNITPRISCAYKLSKSGQMSFAYGTFYQDPESQYLKFTRSLKPEFADHYILNYQYEKNKRVFRIEAYYKKYHNLIKFIKENDTDPDSYDNNGYGFAKGLDLFYRDKSTIPNGDFWVGYSYLDSKRNYRDYPTSATPKYFSKHNFTFVYKQWISRIKSNIGLTYHYLSGRPFYNPNKSDDNFMTDKTKSYTDLSANYAFDLSSFTKLPATLFFSATNIIGENHIYGYNYSTTPDSNNQYTLYPVKSLAKRFYTIAILFSFK